ncbi:MAG: ribosome biogenesis GTPase Der [Planctomycetes bacterium]|nr:ribosome biogenesis GTPase Der [Planctomycetota bacterium]
MPKKFKKGAAKRKQRAGSKVAKKRVAQTAGRKSRRPNAKVVGRPVRKKTRKPRPAVEEMPETPTFRETAQGKPYTKRQKTASELGVETRSHPDGLRLPIVAIVGRPNVGKSSLFNRLAGSRIAIEDPRPGTTRDRVTSVVKLKPDGGEQRVVELFDTAGIGVVDEERVQEHVYEQIDNAVSAADVVIFVVDVREGVVTLDEQAADMLRRTGRKVVIAANKADDPRHDKLGSVFYEFGLGEPLTVSAKGIRKIKDLAGAVCELLPPKTKAELLEPPELLLAIVGRRNVGKSTLVNALAHDERVIASELEGTTRDSVDVRFKYENKTFIAIDTAGVRKRSTLQHSVEFFSQSRSFRAVRRASVVVLMLDAREPITKVDTQLVDLAIEESKPIIVAVNKWDLVKGHKTSDFSEYLQKKLHAIEFAPVVFMSASNKENVFELLEIARELHTQAGFRMGTGELNRLVSAAFDKHHPQPRKNRLGKIFYATQVETYPPKIVVFVNDPDLFPENWRKYLRHQLQEHSDFNEIPIRLKFKARTKVEL